MTLLNLNKASEVFVQFMVNLFFIARILTTRTSLIFWTPTFPLNIVLISIKLLVWTPCGLLIENKFFTKKEFFFLSIFSILLDATFGWYQLRMCWCFKCCPLNYNRHRKQSGYIFFLEHLLISLTLQLKLRSESNLFMSRTWFSLNNAHGGRPSETGQTFLENSPQICIVPSHA